MSSQDPSNTHAAADDARDAPVVSSTLKEPPSVPRRELVGRPDLWGVKRTFQIEFLFDHGLEPDHRLLEVGCGTLRGGIPLIEYLEAGRYVAVESRYEAMRQGLDELNRHGLEEKRPILITADLLSVVDHLPEFDVIWAFSVLFHMRDPVVDDTFTFVATHLRDGGVFYGNVETGIRKEEEWLDFPVIRRPLEWYREKASAHGLSCDELGTLEELGQESGLKRDDEQRMLELRPE